GHDVSVIERITEPAAAAARRKFGDAGRYYVHIDRAMTIGYRAHADEELYVVGHPAALRSRARRRSRTDCALAGSLRVKASTTPATMNAGCLVSGRRRDKSWRARNAPARHHTVLSGCPQEVTAEATSTQDHRVLFSTACDRETRGTGG